MIAVCAATGPAASANPEARLEAMKPRRVNGTFGRRLSRWGSSNWARSFILPPWGALGFGKSRGCKQIFSDVHSLAASSREPPSGSAAARKHAHQPEREGREDSG